MGHFFPVLMAAMLFSHSIIQPCQVTLGSSSMLGNIMPDIVLITWNIVSDSDYSYPHYDIFKYLFLFVNLPRVLPLFSKFYLDEVTTFSFENLV